jgi:hypothetical protein
VGRFGILLRLALEDGEGGVEDGYGIPLLALWQTSLLILLLFWVHGISAPGFTDVMKTWMAFYLFSFVFLEGEAWLGRCMSKSHTCYMS